VAQITSPEAESLPGAGPASSHREQDPGLRQRKKQRTQDALIEAAMDLFKRRGYDHTSVREITDTVEVSERTFFRYFASKEDLVLSFVRNGTASFAAALAARPPQEDPLTAARHAFHASLREVSGAIGDLHSYLSVMRLIDSTPSLLAAYLSCVHEQDDEIIQLLARREGVDPAIDRRPRVLAAVIGTLVFLANRDSPGPDPLTPEAQAEAFDAYADSLMPALAGHWGDVRES
jgi:AcrR family transcriptional regulator